MIIYAPILLSQISMSRDQNPRVPIDDMDICMYFPGIVTTNFPSQKIKWFIVYNIYKPIEN